MACSARVDPVLFRTSPRPSCRATVPAPSLCRIRRPIAAPWGRIIVTETCDERRATEANHAPWDHGYCILLHSIVDRRSSPPILPPVATVRRTATHAAQHSCTAQPPRTPLARDGEAIGGTAGRDGGCVAAGRPDQSSGKRHAWENGRPVRWGPARRGTICRRATVSGVLCRWGRAA
jgi:hypothetical protein